MFKFNNKFKIVLNNDLIYLHFIVYHIIYIFFYLNIFNFKSDLANYDKDTIFPHYITINWSPDGLCECIEEK